MNYTQLPDDILPKVRTWSAMQLAIWADVYTMGKSGMIYYRTNEQLAERWQTDERTVRRVVKQLTELGAVTAEQDGRRRILTAVLDFEERKRTKRSTVQADHGPTSPRTNQSAMEDQAVREGGPTGPQKGDQAVPQVEHRVEQKEKQVIEQGVVLPFESDAFKEMWGIWIQERKDRRYKKLTPRGEQAALHDLQEMSGDDEQTAIKIIKQSIAKNWQGLFPLKNNGKPQLTPEQQANNREQLARYLATGKV